MYTIETPFFTNLTTPGVWALVNEADKKVIVFHASNILEGITRNIKELKTGTHKNKELLADKDKLSIKILAVVPNSNYRLLEHTKWNKHFAKEGFKLYRKRNALEYSVKLKIQRTFYPNKTSYLAYVKLYNRNHEAFIVGIFESVESAKKFIEENYSDDVFTPIYARNRLTREYFQFNKRHRKLVDNIET
jgi:hypothetical protein